MTQLVLERAAGMGAATIPTPMTDEAEQQAAAEERDGKPDYKVYRSRPRFLRRRADGDDGLAELRGAPAAPEEPGIEPKPRRRFPGLPKRLPGRRRPITPGRVLKWVAVALVAWVGLSAILFMVSAQIQRGDLANEVGEQLDPGPYPLTGANTILVLGSDARTEGLAEPGSGGPSRSDSIMLLRIGGGANASLSIPRDTVVDIPGQGQDKINAAYAIGGPALATRTVKAFLGIEINHVVEVSFENFPELIDALGGVTYKGDAVLSRINGGNRNGGYTLRLPKGETEIDGEQALALARTRTNLLDPSEDDLTRARRQQQLVSAMKDKVTSFETFIRLPWVSWEAPKAVRSDMAGPTLLGVAMASITSGSSQPRVLEGSGSITLPNGGVGITVDDAAKQAAVDRLLKG
jgi:LCP family protein required for cell wall assembly